MEFSFWPKTKLKREVESLRSEIQEIRAKTLNNSWNMSDITFGGSNSIITKTTALTLSAVYAAINILCDTLNIPVYVYKRMEDGDKLPVNPQDEYEFQVYRLLHTSPSQLHSPSQWFQIMEFSRMIYGNAYSLIIRDRTGMPRALRWVHPESVDVRFDGVKLWYYFRDDDGGLVAKNIPAWDVIHVKAMSRDGRIGISPIDMARESLTFGKATQEQGNKYFEDGMMNKVIAVHPNQIGPVAQKNLKDSLDAKLKGDGVALLEEGVKLYPMSITNEQSQFLQSREFSVTEVARWFNIPEFMLANNDPTYSNIENFANHFITHNVRPRVRMYEQEFNWKLLGNSPEYYTEFNMDALVRADLKTQAEYFTSALGGVPWMKPNEARSLKNMNKDTSGYGDQFWPPLNAATVNERETDEGNQNI